MRRQRAERRIRAGGCRKWELVATAMTEADFIARGRGRGVEKSGERGGEGERGNGSCGWCGAEKGERGG